MDAWKLPEGTELLRVLSELEVTLEKPGLLPVLNRDRRKEVTAALMLLDQQVHGLLRQLQKQCSTCRELLEPEAFYRDVTRPDGLSSRCRPCVKAARRFDAVKAG